MKMLEATSYRYGWHTKHILWGQEGVKHDYVGSWLTAHLEDAMEWLHLAITNLFYVRLCALPGLRSSLVTFSLTAIFHFISYLA